MYPNKLDESALATTGEIANGADGAAMDACNVRWGRGSVVPARAGLERARRNWSTEFEIRSPLYTTLLGLLPTA